LGSLPHVSLNLVEKGLENKRKAEKVESDSIENPSTLRESKREEFVNIFN